MSSTVNVCALQLSSLPFSESKLDYYLRICKSKNIKLLLLGEYVLNLFFKELVETPPDMIKEQSEYQMDVMKNLSKEYGISIVAPVVRVRGKSRYKSIAIVHPNSLSYYDQQILMPYTHWNEQAYFSNKYDPKNLKPPKVFTVDGVKFGVLFGYELHFDIFFEMMLQKGVEQILLPTVCTFDSNQRWREIIKTRSFTTNTPILRANRIGEYHGEKAVWKFYGDSLYTGADGEIKEALGDKEEMLIATIEKEEIREIRKEWGFYRIKRGIKTC